MSARRCRRFWACHSHVISFNNTITAIFIIFAVITAIIALSIANSTVIVGDESSAIYLDSQQTLGNPVGT